MLTTGIVFEERYDNEFIGTSTLYFIAPKEMLKTMISKDYPEAIAMEIMIEFPISNIDANYANVQVSPTKETDSGTEDYDWHDVNLSYNEIKELIALAKVQ